MQSESIFNFNKIISNLDSDHQKKLLWALHNKNKNLAWSEIVKNKMATTARGIYKPEKWIYALSAKTVIDGPYDDGDVFVQPSSTEWMAIYKPDSDPSSYTNKAMRKCQKDKIPLIYFKQTSKKPNTSYRVIGPCLCWHEKKSNSYFLFGFSDDGFLSNHLFKT